MAMSLRKYRHNRGISLSILMYLIKDERQHNQLDLFLSNITMRLIGTLAGYTYTFSQSGLYAN